MKKIQINNIINILASVMAVSFLAVSPTACRAEETPTSPDKKFKAEIVNKGGGSNYKVVDARTGGEIFTTHPQYPASPNDVKAGAFSEDSKFFAASYHYGHAGNYTFVGVWSLTKSNLVTSSQETGWLDSIPKSVFKKAAAKEEKGKEK